MSGTAAGGTAAKETNIKRYGEDFYRHIGALGGKASGTGGFYYSKVHGLDWHVKAGIKGGKTSRRGKAMA